MFSSKSKDASPAPAPQPSTPALQPKRPRSAAAPSIISSDLTVTGTLTSTGDIQIDGRVEGDVRSAGLVIGDKAFIQGEVIADDVIVRGRVEGNIRARKVLLASTCHVEGNILHEAFAVETGAFFEGNCRHAENPAADESKGGKTSEISRPASPIMPSPAPVSSPSVATIGASRMASAPSAASFAPLKPTV
jgi:cytoskeletal protein CcmA (bactofilin family)